MTPAAVRLRKVVLDATTRQSLASKRARARQEAGATQARG